MKKVSKLTAGKNKEPAYISVEFKNWKKTPEGFKDHQNSKCHKEAEHCVKSVRIRSSSGPHFSRIFPVPLCFQSECEKMREKCRPE